MAALTWSANPVVQESKALPVQKCVARVARMTKQRPSAARLNRCENRSNNVEKESFSVEELRGKEEEKKRKETAGTSPGMSWLWRMYFGLSGGIRHRHSIRREETKGGGAENGKRQKCEMWKELKVQHGHSGTLVLLENIGVK